MGHKFSKLPTIFFKPCDNIYAPQRNNKNNIISTFFNCSMQYIYPENSLKQ
jgi:hypothetical protein